MGINYNRSSNTFQLNIIKSINKSKLGENYFISPLSIYLLMKILYHGADQQTKSMLEKTLSSGLSKKEFNSLSKINKQINTIEDMKLANAIFTKTAPLKLFLDECKDYDILISKSSNIAEINNWCKNKTQGKIG